MAAPTERPTTSVRQFHDLVERFYDETFERFPAWGTDAGRHEFDAELGHNDPVTWMAQGALIESTLAAIEDLPHQDFCASDLLDRRTMLANLRQDRLRLVTLRRWENDPQIHLQGAAGAVYDLFVRHADDLRPIGPALLTRLKRIPRFLDEGAACLRRPDPLWKGLAIKAGPAVAEFFISLAEPLANALGQPVAGVRRVARRAAEASLAYVERLQALRAAPAGSYAIGEERFTLLMNERLAVNYSPREAVAIARRLVEQLREEQRREARRFHPRKSAAEILDDARSQWKPEGANLMEAYQRVMGQMRERFVEAGWITFPKGDRLLLKAVPEFMRDQFPTAAYSSPGPLDPDQTGIFWVNDLSSEVGTDVQRQAELGQHLGLELTCAHEAYPGHHLQFVSQHRHPSLARKMANHAIYYEGWTLWCEQMVIDLNIPESPYLRLQQLNDALWRAWRIVIDVGLHTRELTYNQACEILEREVGFTHTRAQGDINWYTGLPTVPMSYLLGKSELMRLKRLRVDSGGMSLREFNDWVLSFGAIPWRWIEESGL